MKVDSRTIWQSGLIGVVVALVANLAIYAAGYSAGVEFILPPGGFSPAVGVTEVILSTVVAFAVGTALAVIVGRRSARALRVMQIVGAAAAVVSIPAPLMAVGTASKVLLVAMHLVSGVVFVLALERARRQLHSADQSERARSAAAS